MSHPCAIVVAMVAHARVVRSARKPELAQLAGRWDDTRHGHLPLRIDDRAEAMIAIATLLLLMRSSDKSRRDEKAGNRRRAPRRDRLPWKETNAIVARQGAGFEREAGSEASAVTKLREGNAIALGEALQRNAVLAGPGYSWALFVARLIHEAIATGLGRVPSAASIDAPWLLLARGALCDDEIGCVREACDELGPGAHDRAAIATALRDALLGDAGEGVAVALAVRDSRAKHAHRADVALRGGIAKRTRPGSQRVPSKRP